MARIAMSIGFCSVFLSLGCSMELPNSQFKTNKASQELILSLQVKGEDQVQQVVSPRGNPYEGRSMYVASHFSKMVRATMEAHSDQQDQLSRIINAPTAAWIVNRSMLPYARETLEGARSQQQFIKESVVVTFVVYNLPNRDCNAGASSGELWLDQNGLEIYKSEFIDPLAALFSEFDDIKVSIILEPDSLPNMVTNLSNPSCTTAEPGYREGIAYALQKFYLPNVSVYLDTAHSGWLGWDANRQGMARIFKEVLDDAGGVHLLRGFSTNVSNYTPLYQADEDPRPEEFYQYNPTRDELTFISKFKEDLENAGIENAHFVVDTSRNGNPLARLNTWGNWCNIKDAGLGERPQVNPNKMVDAYLWIKTPGESDGPAGKEAGGEYSCNSSDSYYPAVPAGEWFMDYFLMLIKNANPPL